MERVIRSDALENAGSRDQKMTPVIKSLAAGRVLDTDLPETFAFVPVRGNHAVAQLDKFVEVILPSDIAEVLQDFRRRRVAMSHISKPPEVTDTRASYKFVQSGFGSQVNW